MKVLVVYSATIPGFSLVLHQSFIFEQVEAIKRFGVKIDNFGIEHKGLCGYLRSMKGLLNKIKEFEPDIIHAHYGLSGLLANLQRKVPVITTFHGSDIHSGGLLLKLSRLSMKLSKYNIFVSNRLYELANYCKENVMVLPCGVDFDNFVVLSKDEARMHLVWDLTEKFVLFASAFDNEIKNPELAKQACRLLSECKLIELKGYSREEVNLLMNACDCLLMTSHQEGSPMVIKEAMLCGTPIVSVDVGDVKDVVGDTEGCFIVDKDADAIAIRISDAIKFSIEQGKTNGRDRIMELGLDNKQIAEQILRLYNNVIEQ